MFVSKPSLALTNESYVAIMDMNKQMIINNEDRNIGGRLIFTLGDFIVRYFIDYDVKLFLSRFCFESLSMSFYFYLSKL